MPTDPSGPDASVVVPSHHGAHRLPHLLAQLAAQECDRPWEVVVVVDGVVDDTPALLAAWHDRLPLRIVTHQVARGVAAALTSGYAAARGSYLIRCDDDPTSPLASSPVTWRRTRGAPTASCSP